jgi:hypothetical protein
VRSIISWMSGEIEVKRQNTVQRLRASFHSLLMIMKAMSLITLADKQYLKSASNHFRIIITYDTNEW